MAIAADGSTEGASSPCCSLWRVDMARRGPARFGVVGFGTVRRQLQTAARRTTVLPAAFFGEWTGLGSVRSGKAVRSKARRGPAIAADGSTGGFGFLCCSLRRADAVGSGQVRLGKAALGGATVADGSTEALGLPCCSLWRVVVAVWGTLRHG
jgi:hypothetical protein